MEPFLVSLLLLNVVATHPKVEVRSGSLDTKEGAFYTYPVVIPADSVYEGHLATRGDITIKGRVGDDLAVNEGTLNLEGSAARDVALMGSKFLISGTVEGDIAAVGSEGALSGKVEGDVVIFGGKLELDSTAIIGGNLVNIGAQLVTREGAVVKGDKVDLGGFGCWASRLFVHKGKPGLSFERLRSIMAGVRLGFVVLIYLLGLLMLVALPSWQRRSRLLVERNPWKMLLAGVILRLAVLAIFVVLLVSVIGWVLLPFALLGWAFLALMAVPQASLWVAERLKRWWKLETRSMVGLYSLGFAALYLLYIVGTLLWALRVALAGRLIGIIGFLVIFAIVTLGRGGIIYALLFRKEAKALEDEAGEKP